MLRWFPRGPLALLVLAGCGDALIDVDLDEIRGDHGAMVLALQGAGAPTVVAIDLPSGAGHDQTPVIRDADVGIHAVLFDRNLAAMDVRPGLVPASADGGGIPMRWRAAFSRQITGDDAGGWSSVDTLPKSLLEFRGASFPRRCPSLDVGHHELDPDADVTAAIQVADSALLFLSAARPDLKQVPAQIFRVDGSGATRIDASIPRFAQTFDQVGLLAAASGPGSTLWLATAVTGRATLWAGDLDRGFQSVGSPPQQAGKWVQWLLVHGPAGAERIYLLNDWGSLFMYDAAAASWHTLHLVDTLEPVRCLHPRRFCGGLAADDDRVVALHPRGTATVTVHDVRTGSTSVERIDALVPETVPTALTRSAVGVTVLATGPSTARLYRRDARAWVPHGPTVAVGEGVAVAPYRSGAVIANSAGDLAGYLEDEWCPTDVGAITFNPGHAITVGDLSIFASANASSEPGRAAAAVVRMSRFSAP